MKPLILASTSPRRKSLLEQLGLPFEIIPSAYEEDMTLPLAPVELAQTLSLGKAQEVAGKVREGIIIAADTFVFMDDKLLGKPKDEADATRMLKEQSGKRIGVVTGVTLIDANTKKTLTNSEVSYLHIKQLTDKEITSYVNSGEPLDKAGAFGIQGRAALFIEHIEGTYSNIMGLPLYTLGMMLAEFGVDVWE